jgi:rod shape-determining protein MreD
VTISFPGVLRIAALVLLSVVLELAVVTQITIFGANVDLLVLVTLSVGLLAGPVAGAVVGFMLGLVADMALVQTLGVTSLLLTGVGYLAGRFRELRDATHKLVPTIGGFVAALGFSVCFAMIQFLLGVDSTVSVLVARDAVAGALLSGLAATPVFAIVRRVLRPDLIDELRPRRRSRPVTGLRLTP